MQLSAVVAEAKGLPPEVIECALDLIARERGAEQVRNNDTAVLEGLKLAA